MKKLFSAILAAALCFSMSFCASAIYEVDDFDGIESTAPTGYVTDNANILNQSEEKALGEKLEEISEKYGKCDVLVYTVNNINSSAMVYADDRLDEYLDETGKEDGILLLVAMGSREWHLTTTGYAIEAFTDYGLGVMEDKFVSKLSDGDYYGAFDKYADLCDEFLDEAINDEPYDITHRYRTVFDYVIMVAIGFGIGILAAAIATSTMKKQLKNVTAQKAADNYVKQGSLNVDVKKDLFLYNSVSKTRRSSSSSGHGGSSTHRSSGGRSHGGRGGHF